MANPSNNLVAIGLLAVDHEGRVISSNEEGEALLGIKQGKAVGLRLVDLVDSLKFPEEDIATHLSMVHVLAKDEDSRRVACTLTSAVVGDEKLWLVALQDLSGQVAREAELIEMADLAVK